MIQAKVPGRRWLPLGLALVAIALVTAATATAAAGKSSATPIKFAIMSDCGGAFAANYQQDIGGAITAVSEFGGAKPNVFLQGMFSERRSPMVTGAKLGLGFARPRRITPHINEIQGLGVSS